MYKLPYVNYRKALLGSRPDANRENTVKNSVIRDMTDEKPDKDVDQKPLENIKNTEHSGFVKLAPGIFQFKRSVEITVLPALPKELQKEKQMILSHFEYIPESGERGFIRVDGLPGPYENYDTPVFQFR